jgi:S1-C subfamily serine protease
VLAAKLSATKVARVTHGLTCVESVAAEGRDRQKVVVEKVTSAGAKAGLKKGDVIVKLGEMALQNRFDVERALWGCKAGDKVHAVVLREGKPTTLAITLAAAQTELTSR